MDIPIILGTVASLLAGGATAIVAAFIFFFRNKMSEAVEDALLSTAAGIMLAATMFSLIHPAFETAQELGFSSIVSALHVVLGIFLGVLVLSLIHKMLPHEHFFSGQENVSGVKVRRMWLFIIAITIHNIPEGMAVGVGFGSGEINRGLPLALGIAAQNIPEGFAVAAALLSNRYSARKAFLISTLTGLLEVTGGFVGAALSALSTQALPVVLSFAGGAMLFVISDEIIPETHSRGNKTLATWCLMIGFCAMFVLDVSFQ